MSAAEFHLDVWARFVVRAERGDELVDFCPCCSGEDALDSRDRLEAMIRRGGKQGRRIQAAVKPLDERFEAATYPTLNGEPNFQSGDWWWQRAWG